MLPAWRSGTPVRASHTVRGRVELSAQGRDLRIGRRLVGTDVLPAWPVLGKGKVRVESVDLLRDRVAELRRLDVVHAELQLVKGLFTQGGGSVSPVGELVPLVGHPLAFVGDLLALVEAARAADCGCPLAKLGGRLAQFGSDPSLLDRIRAQFRRGSKLSVDPIPKLRGWPTLRRRHDLSVGTEPTGNAASRDRQLPGADMSDIATRLGRLVRCSPLGPPAPADLRTDWQVGLRHLHDVDG